MEVLDGGGRVLFATGFVVPPFLRLETDGPLGVAVLGRALALGLRRNPVVVVEPDGVAAMETVMAASGLALARDLDETRDVPNKTAVAAFSRSIRNWRAGKRCACWTKSNLGPSLPWKSRPATSTDATITAWAWTLPTLPPRRTFSWRKPAGGAFLPSATVTAATRSAWAASGIRCAPSFREGRR